jgi:hypothetical protein
MEIIKTKEEWRFVLRDDGERFVRIHGITEMLRWFANSLGLDQQELFPTLVLTMVREQVQCS